MNPYMKRFLQEIEREAWMTQSPYYSEIAHIYDLMFYNSSAASPKVISGFQERVQKFEKAVKTLPSELSEIFEEIGALLGRSAFNNFSPEAKDLFPETVETLGKIQASGFSSDTSLLDLFLENLPLDQAVEILQIIKDPTKKQELEAAYKKYMIEEAQQAAERRNKMSAIANVLLSVMKAKSVDQQPTADMTPAP